MIIDIGPLTILIIAISYILYALYDIKYKGNKNMSNYLFLFIFFVYFINLLKYAVFPIHFSEDVKNIMQEERTILEIVKLNTNLIPFSSGFDKKDFLLNIIMTLPLGFLIPCLKRDLNNKKVIILGLATGLLIEFIQLLLIFLQGFTFRNININDTIANFIGVYLGYKIFLLSFPILFKAFQESKENNGFINKFKPMFEYILKLNQSQFKI